MEKKERKLKLSTIICIIIILLLVVAEICIYFYFNPIETTVANSGIEETNSKGSTSLNINQSENSLQLNFGNNTLEKNETVNSESNTQANDTIPQTDKYDIQYVKDTITLNGKEHTYEVRYSSNMNLISAEDAYYTSDAVILLDNKIVKNTTIRYFEENKTKDSIKVSTMKNKYGETNQEYLVLNIDSRVWATGTQESIFYIINENAEIIETINFGYGTNIIIDGKTVTYELKEDRLIWYEYNGPGEKEQDIAVVKYEMYVGNNRSYFSVLRTYKSSEVELAGKV